MRLKLFVMGLLATTLPLQSVLAQATMLTPYGGTKPHPVPMTPPADPKDTPEEIAKDAARDLKGSRFYNKPGATRAQYDADWQQCRLIARGSRTPSGAVPYYCNPALVSPVAAGVGGALGGLIAGAIAEGAQRRANRRTCLLIKGWRMIEVPAAETARIGAMSDDQRSAYFDTIVGAEHVDGTVTERTSFTLAADPQLNLDAPVLGSGSVFLGKKVDSAQPFKLAAGEAAIVIAYRRPDAGSAGRTGTLQLARYDVAARDLIYQPKNWKKIGDKTTYLVSSRSADRNAALEVQVLRVTPGDYVISGGSVGSLPVTSSNCFGAPTFHVGEGETVYIGDFIPFWNVRTSTGARMTTLAYSPHLDDARRVLSTRQPELAAALKPATLHNRATYACSAISMDRWDLPGIDSLPEPEPEPAASTSAG